MPTTATVKRAMEAPIAPLMSTSVFHCRALMAFASIPLFAQLNFQNPIALPLDLCNAGLDVARHTYQSMRTHVLVLLGLQGITATLILTNVPASHVRTMASVCTLAPSVLPRIMRVRSWGSRWSAVARVFLFRLRTHTHVSVGVVGWASTALKMWTNASRVHVDMGERAWAHSHVRLR